MIINNTYTIRVVESNDPNNFLSHVSIKEGQPENLVDIELFEREIRIITKENLGRTMVVVHDVYQNKIEIPIVVDDLDYEFKIVTSDGSSFTEFDTMTMMYNSDYELVVIPKIYSNLDERYIDLEDPQASIYGVVYTISDFGIANNGAFKDIVVSEDKKSLTLTTLNKTAKRSAYVTAVNEDGVEFPVIQDFFVSDKFSLSTNSIAILETETTPAEVFVLGNDPEADIWVDLEESTADINTFSWEIDQKRNKISIIVLEPGLIDTEVVLPYICVKSILNGVETKDFLEVNIIPVPFKTVDNEIVVKLGKSIELPIYNLIGEFKELNNEYYSIVHKEVTDEFGNTKDSIIVTPKQPMPEFTDVELEDLVADLGRTNIRTTNLRFRIPNELRATVVRTGTRALGAPAVIKFEKASPGQTVEVKAQSLYDGSEYSSNIILKELPYGNFDSTQGTIEISASVEDVLGVYVFDGISYDYVEVEFIEAIINPDELARWSTIIEYASDEDMGTGSLSAEETEGALLPGEFIGLQWVEGYKFRDIKLNKIRYRITLPDNLKGFTEESYQWLKNLDETPDTTLKISIRDGFILNNIGKEYEVNATHVGDAVFETEDISGLGIIISKAEAVLLSDTTHSIAATENKDLTGVSVLIDTGGNETVLSRQAIKPIVYLDFNPLKVERAIPLEKPINCADIRRLNPQAESEEYTIFPFAVNNERIDVICEFNSYETWTSLPTNYLTSFVKMQSRTMDHMSNPLEIVSNNGIRPEFVTDGRGSDKQPGYTYTFLELPYKVSEIKFDIDTRIETEGNSLGIFKIMSDTSDIHHIRGSLAENQFISRRGVYIDYDLEITKKNLGQVLVMPEGYEDTVHSENNIDGHIKFDQPTDRIVIMNSGTMATFDLVESFLKSLKLKTVFSADNRSNRPWSMKGLPKGSVPDEAIIKNF